MRPSTCSSVASAAGSRTFRTLTSTTSPADIPEWLYRSARRVALIHQGDARSCVQERRVFADPFFEARPRVLPLGVRGRPAPAGAHPRATRVVNGYVIREHVIGSPVKQPQAPVVPVAPQNAVESHTT